MKLSRLLLMAALGLAVASGAQAQGAGTPAELGQRFYRNMGFLDIPRAEAPYFPFGDRRLLFTWAPPGSVNQNASTRTALPRLVSIAFAHENFSVLHTMSRSKEGVYSFVWDITREEQEALLASGRDVEYRYVVDGVWTADPNNPYRIQKLNGAVLSGFETARIPALEMLSPLFPDKQASSGKRRVVLQFAGEPGLEIFVGGTFNNFDPYLHTMKEEPASPGLYRLDLRLRTGQYFYYFVINGKTVLDPLNRNLGYGPEGTPYSRIDVPSP